MQVYPFRAAHWVTMSLGVIALLLTATGIYGVLSFIVALRRAEIAVRVALGASRSQVVGLVVRQSIRLAAIGIVLGAAMALGVSMLISSQLTMIPSFDVVALIGGIIVVMLAAIGAAYVPSRQAAAVDPVAAMKG